MLIHMRLRSLITHSVTIVGLMIMKKKVKNNGGKYMLVFEIFLFLAVLLSVILFGKIAGIALSIFFGFAKIGFKICLIVFALLAILFFL